MSVISFPSQPFVTRAARNFLVHSGHVPLVLLILEALLASPGYFFRIDAYLLLAAGLVQACVAERQTARTAPHALIANLVGPLVYTALEVMVEGGDFFLQWHHQAYWGFAFGFGVLQGLQIHRPKWNAMLVLAESVLRSAIPLVLYAMFEARSKSAVLSLEVFFGDRAHTFLVIVLLLLGVLLGFAEVSLRNSLARVHALTAQLRQYSEWSLGRGILNKAIDDATTLSLKRVDRAIVFMDIRGFTAWSEQQTPEAVVGMLNDFYAAAEASLGTVSPIKLKYTADEVMAVFADAKDAVRAGTQMLAGTQAMLDSMGLKAGAGVHVGQVVEGVLGAQGAKAYDFIGDTVNTAQRLCDAAAPGELLASVQACAAADIAQGQTRDVVAKGKREPLRAAVVGGVA
ncbi:MAG: adenylate/guanylate cyclase domain-containing protein [Burkholderiales bacterium]